MHCGVQLQAARDFLRMSLKRFFGAPLSPCLVESPVQRSCNIISLASMLETSTWSSTLTFETKSLQWILRRVRRQG